MYWKKIDKMPVDYQIGACLQKNPRWFIDKSCLMFYSTTVLYEVLMHSNKRGA